MNTTETQLRRAERDLWGRLMGALFDLAVLILLGFALYRAADRGDWAWVAIDAVMFLALVIEQAANKIVHAIKGGQQ